MSPTNCRNSSRRGFTLFEVLLTLIVLVILAGFSWPMLNRSFDGQRLRMAADQLRAEIGAARAAAINSGQVQVLQFNIGEDGYSGGLWQPDGVAIEQVSSFLPLTSPEASDPSSLDAELQATRIWSTKGQLPPGVTFYLGGALADPLALTALPPIPRNSNLLASESTATGDTHILMFFPDGTTTDGKVWITNARAQAIAVHLRGLTGIARVTDLFSQEEILP